MAHFAEIDENNIVLRVIVVNNNELLNELSIEDETKGKTFCSNLFGGSWIQTSYNNNFRKNFAGIGYTYDENRDAFVPIKPYKAWVLDSDTCHWNAPINLPADHETVNYTWDSDTNNWTS